MGEGATLSGAMSPSARTRQGKLSKQEHVYRDLRQRIVRGELRPGVRLVMDTLSREYGVSTVPVREAIRRLEAEGWVAFERNVGAQVAKFDRDRWIATTHMLSVLSSAATALAVPFLKVGDLDEARSHNRRFAEAIQNEDSIAQTDANRALHEVLARRCPNHVLLESTRQVWDRLDAIRSSVFIFMPARSAAAVDEHEAMIDLLEQGCNGPAIAAELESHILRTIGAVLMQLGVTRDSGEMTWDVTAEEVGRYLHAKGRVSYDRGVARKSMLLHH